MSYSVDTMKRKKRIHKQSPEVRAFIKGTSDSVTIRLDPTKVARGPDFVLARSKGGGPQGKVGRDLNRSDRQHSKRALRHQRHV